MNWVRELQKTARDFAHDDAGTAGLEFVTTVPLLLGVLVFTAEYGEALRSRMALDSAVQDIARYLARAPVDRVVVSQGLPPEIQHYPGVLTEAQALLGQRIEPVLFFRVQTTTVDSGTDEGGTFRDPYYVIEVVATTWEELPLMSVINIFSGSSISEQARSGAQEGPVGDLPLGITMTSSHTVRWVGGALPGDADCQLADRYRGICP